MENKKLQEQIRMMKTLMSEQETKEGMVDDIKKFLYDKVSGAVSGTKLGNALDDLLDGITPSKEDLTFTDQDSEKMSDEEKKNVYSKVVTDDDFYKAILWGLGLPTTEHNINFFKLWRIAEMGIQKEGKQKPTATNNPFNTTFSNSLDKDQTNFNYIGVKNYSKPEYGIESTVKTLKNGYYNCILDGLKKGSDYKEIASCSRRDGKKSAMDTWGTTSKGLLAVIERFQNNPKVARKIDMELE